MSGTRSATRSCIDCNTSIFEGKQGRNTRCEPCKKLYKKQYQRMDYIKNRTEYSERARVNYYKKKVLQQDLEEILN